MKALIAIATGLLIMSPAGAAPARAAVEYFPAPARPDGSAPPFSSAVRVGDVLYLAGQLGIGADGKLPDGIDAQTKQALENIGAVLKRAGLGYKRRIPLHRDVRATWRSGQPSTKSM